MTKKRQSRVRKMQHARKQSHTIKQHRTASKRCANFKAILLKLKKLKRPHQVQALRLANGNFIRKFCSHVQKLRHAKLSPTVLKNVKRHNKILRKLIHKKSSINDKRKILTQHGGGFFIPLLAAVAGSIASSIFRK